MIKMIILNEEQFGKFTSNSRVLENSYVYLISRDLKPIDGEDGKLLGNDSLATLCPSEALYGQLIDGSINNKTFAKKYIKELKSYENKFLMYTIMRAFNEKQFLPIFICSDAEWETKYLKIFASYITKVFGIKPIKASKYRKTVSAIYKKTKKVNKRRKKVFRKMLVDYIRDNAQLSMDGIELLESLDKAFAIDRIAILINQSDITDKSISKKSVIKAIQLYASCNKKSAKLVKSVMKKLKVSKKINRWSGQIAYEVALTIYSEIHSSDK